MSQGVRIQMQDVAVGTLSSEDSRNDPTEFESKGVETYRSKDETKSIDFAQEESIVGTSIMEAPVVTAIRQPLVDISHGLMQLGQNLEHGL